MGKECERVDICTCVTDILCCTAETNTTLQINYSPIIFFFNGYSRIVSTELKPRLLKFITSLIHWKQIKLSWKKKIKQSFWETFTLCWQGWKSILVTGTPGSPGGCSPGPHHGQHGKDGSTGKEATLWGCHISFLEESRTGKVSHPQGGIQTLSTNITELQESRQVKTWSQSLRSSQF